MFTVDLVVLQRMTTELESCERRLNRERLLLEDTIRQLSGLRQKGMDQVRYTLKKRAADIQEETRAVRAMHQVLSRILSGYRESEGRIRSGFEHPWISPVVWQAFPVPNIHILLKASGTG